MARIFITGSSDGIGLLAAKELISKGHKVAVHARNEERGQHTLAKLPGAEILFIADLSSIAETKELAAKANDSGKFDVVIHNAGVYQIPEKSKSADGLPLLFAVNSLAPYILTCLIKKPARLIYLSSDMHLHADPTLENLNIADPKQMQVNYSDTKYHDLILAMAVARLWPDVMANALHPGWVPTKMGGPGARDDLRSGYETQVWLAESNEADAMVSGNYFHHKKPSRYLKDADSTSIQNKFLSFCRQFSGVTFPAEQV